MLNYVANVTIQNTVCSGVTDSPTPANFSFANLSFLHLFCYGLCSVLRPRQPVLLQQATT